MDSQNTARTNQGRKITHIWESVSLFLGALPLFILWLTIPLLLLIASSIYQSGRLMAERQDRMRHEKAYSFTLPSTEVLTLHLSYPRRLRIDPDTPYDDSLVLWLTGPAPDLAATAPLPVYTFAIRPGRAADLIDETGQPVPDVVQFSLAEGGIDSRTLYLKVDGSLLRTGENLQVAVEGLTPITDVHSIEIPVEPVRNSRMRHFWDAVLGLPTIIGSLLTAIAGFGVQQWNALNARKQKEAEELQKTIQKEEDEACRKLEEAFERSDYQLAFEVRRRYLENNNNSSQRFRKLFEERAAIAITNEFDRAEFTQAIQLFNLIVPANLEALKNTWEYSKSAAVSSLRVHDISKAKWLIDILVKHGLASESERALSTELENGVAYIKLAQLLKLHPEIIMRSDRLSSEYGDIKKGMDIMRMGINPFGSEKVEDDLRFDGRFDRVLWKRDVSLEGVAPAVLDYVKTIYPISVEDTQAQSQLFLGPKGSGKTALALLIAGLSLLSKEKMLPVYCRISSKDDAHVLLHQIAAALLNYYVKNCWEFQELDTATTSAISVLLANYLANGPELSFRLKIAGLSKEPLSDDFHGQLMAMTDLAKSVNLTYGEAARILSQISSPEYKGLLFIFDHQDNPERISTGNAEIIRFMAHLQQAGAICKIFSMPSAFSNTVRKQIQLPALTLVWDETKIRQVLENQMKNCDIAGAGIFFDPSLRSISRNLMVRASKDGPGNLVHIGNEILTQIGRTGRPLNIKDVEGIFGKSLVRKVLRESLAS